MLEVRYALERTAEQFTVDLECREEVTEWMFEEDLSKQIWIYGYFLDEQSLLESWQTLLGRYPEWRLPEVPQYREIAEKDWQDSYRKFFSARTFGRLHWVPGWQKESYAVAAGEVVLYLDPGMAFGTGEHETTRLCMEAFQGWHEQEGQPQLDTARVVDAGCGSGILALSALLLGYQRVLAFDNDPLSVEVSENNRSENGIPARWELRLADLQSGLHEVRADCLMANIQADVLMRGAEYLVRAVGGTGVLILSGILIQEKEQVRQHFLAEYQRQGLQASCSEKEDGEWCALILRV